MTGHSNSILKSIQHSAIYLFAPDRTYIKLLAYLKAMFECVLYFVRHPSRQTLHKISLALRVKPWYTMLSAPRLFDLYDRVSEAKDTPGDIVECGVWRGGGLAMMATADQRQGRYQRRYWAFDSFQGLPPPGEQDGQAEQEQFHHDLNVGSIEMLRRIFRRLRLPGDHLEIVPGWFQTTLPTADVGTIAVLHIDGDWYDSVKIVLDCFYDRVTPGGYVVVDDYHYWIGCKRAVDTFLLERKLEVTLMHGAPHAVYFQKPEPSAG